MFLFFWVKLMFWYLPSWDLSVIRKFFVCPSPTQIPLIESKNSRYIFFATFNTYHQTESRFFFLSPTPHIWLRKATYPSEWPRDRPRSWLDQCAWEKPRCSSHLPGSDPRGRFIATWCVGKPLVGDIYIYICKKMNQWRGLTAMTRFFITHFCRRRSYNTSL